MFKRRSAALETPIEGLRATPPAKLPFLANAQVRSFILERPKNNAFVCNSPGLSEAADEIRALGDASHLLINHGYEAMYGPPGWTCWCSYTSATGRRPPEAFRSRAPSPAGR